MSASIRQELLLFLRSVQLGCVLHLLYDLLRGLREALSCGKRALAVTDFLYWIFGGCFLFVAAFRENQGILRSFLLIGLLLGACLWNRTFSASFVKIWSILVSYPIFLLSELHLNNL